MKHEELKHKLTQIAEGVLVEDDVLGVVKAIMQYDPNLRVQYVDPAKAEFFDAPYRVVEKCKDSCDRVVFTCWKLDKSVLQRLFAADMQKNNILLSLEGKIEVARRERIRRYEDSMGQAQDIIVHMLNSPKTTYTAVDKIDGKQKKITFSSHKQWEKPSKELD